MKACLDCGRPQPATRCPSCAEAIVRKVSAQRGTTAQRGYDSKWQIIRRSILDRDGWQCRKCGKRLQGADATVDHAIPLSKAPHLRLEPSNLQAMCRACNSGKKNR